MVVDFAGPGMQTHRTNSPIRHPPHDGPSCGATIGSARESMAINLRFATTPPVPRRRWLSSIGGLMTLAAAALGATYYFENIYLAQVLRPGLTFRDCTECPEMVVMPTGSFLMGPSLSEPERDPNESPSIR